MIKLLKKLKINRLLKRLNINKSWNDKEEEELWLADLWHDKGFKSYGNKRIIEIQKEIANAVYIGNFNKAVELSGRRLEILKLLDSAKREWLKKE